IVKLLRDSNPDSIYIEKSTGFKSSVYVFRKNVFNISINVKNMKKGYIPKDLTDCITQLDKIMDEASKIWCRKHSEQYFSYKAHHGLGMWIRNNWKLWGSSRLSKYFNELGIYHPDDMSGIILKSYYRYLNSEEINLDEQIKYYQDFWENRE
nr:hypothetical protein [Bacteroidota bacterium]